MNDISSYLDSTNLSHTATKDEIKQLANDAMEYGFEGICIAPCWVVFAKQYLMRNGGQNVKVVTVPNWSLGGGLEQLEGIADLACDVADEVDYIWNCYNFSDLKDWDKTKEELATIRKKVKGTLKIIIEAYYLRKSDEKLHQLGLAKVFKQACKLVNESKADWIKTDSGLFKRPDFDSLAEDCKYIVKYSKIPVKAAGGIRTKPDAVKLIELGVKRLGTSNAVKIATSDL